jgi:hypothetical protein
MRFNQIFVAVCLSSVVIAHGHGKQGGETDAGGGKKNGTSSAKSESAQCNEISRLTQLTDFANNATKLTELETKHNLTAAEIDDIKSAATNATAKLTELTANATLVSQCGAIAANKKLKSQCKEIQRLTEVTNLANNATFLSELQAKRNLTADQMDEIKSEAANATAKLQQLTSNATLASSCQTQQASSTKGGKHNSTGELVLCLSKVLI